MGNVNYIITQRLYIFKNWKRNIIKLETVYVMVKTLTFPLKIDLFFNTIR